VTVNHKPPAGNTINPKLAETIKNLPEERQLNLLKQLLNGNITAALLGLIRKRSADEQLTLLQQLQEHPIISPYLEETEIALRGHPRKSCMISTNYKVGGRNFEGFVLDVSPAGAFIEAGEAFTAGQQIQLAFSLPNNPGQMNVSGEILWKGKLGIGLKFKDLSRQQIDLITAFIEEK
jgi:Tfp pilus assembly protein PilZ